ncbi:SLAC1 anion channel family protein [Sulfuricystis multivorans]|uniref:SLAC1 anion channel family protein n=1 Tax=Sulfuricystis multivorans TaxID=2211108 RepID=UPI000F842850|nr:SLAC1 anion channel family protein [Sulfuricystis multivorans]
MTNPSPATPSAPHSRLAHYPIPLFATVMGTSGLAIAWKKAGHVLGLPAGIGISLQWWALVLFVMVGLGYLAKMVSHWEAVKKEFSNPIRLNFFPAISISLLLLAVTFTESQASLALGFWSVGAVLHLAFTLFVMSSWIHHTRYEIKHVNPAWFIPIVGNVIVPVGGVTFAPAAISWFFFSIGLVFWVVLLTIVMNRLFFHEPLPERLTPTLFILIAPPAVGFIAWLKLTGGQIDAFAQILYSVALFLTLLLASNALRFFRLRFFLSTWAYSFPLAAITIATLIMAEHGSGFFVGLSWLLLIVLSLVLLLLTLRTALAVMRGEICVPE